MCLCSTNLFMNLFIYVLQQRTLFRIAGILPQQRVNIEVTNFAQRLIPKEKTAKRRRALNE